MDYLHLGATAPTFETFAKANEILAYGGVDGPVTVAIRNGKYIEQPTVKYTRGVSLANTITYRGELNNAVADTLTFSSTGGNPARYATMRLDSAAFITFKNITFESISSYSREVEFTNHTRYITFDSCVFTAAASNASYPHIEAEANSFSMPATDSNFIFTNNIFKKGGNIGINLPIKNGLIKGNRFENLNGSSGYAISISGSYPTNMLVIDSNYVTSDQVCSFSFGGICYGYSYPSAGGISVTATGPLNNISITRNRIYAVNRTGINVTSNGTSFRSC